MSSLYYVPSFTVVTDRQLAILLRLPPPPSVVMLHVTGERKVGLVAMVTKIHGLIPSSLPGVFRPTPLHPHLQVGPGTPEQCLLAVNN